MPDKDKIRLAPYAPDTALADDDYVLVEDANGVDRKMSGETLKSTFGVLIDEDDMSSDDATKVPSQQSVKAYVDNTVADFYRVATGTVATGDVLALNATPVELIAAPGANKAIVVDEIQLFLDHGGTDYAADAGEDLTIEYSGGTDIAVIDNDAVTFLTASADAHWLGKNFALYDASVAGTGDGVLLSGFDNEAVNMTIATGEVITGNSDIKYKITYHVVDYLT